MGAGTAVIQRESSLRQLELMINRKLDGLLHGDFESLVPGTGTEKGSSRLYQPGDDARLIDWNLTARSHTTHVRTTIAERELETWLVVDGSASLDFGTGQWEKRDLALAAAGAFGLLGSRSGNRVGALVLGGDGDLVVPPRSGRDAVMGVLRRLETRPRAGEVPFELADGLARVRRTARRRGLVVVISDFLDRGPWAHQLRLLRAHHEVIAVEISDPREWDLPPVGLLTLVDPETGRRREVQTSERLRVRFAEAAAQRRAETVAALRGAGVAHLSLSTDRDWLGDLVRFATTRKRARS